VQTFHALGVVKRRQQGAKDTSPPSRLERERMLAREVDRIVATCSDEVFELVRMGADLRRTTVVPCGVDLGLFRPDGPAEPRDPDRSRLLVVSRLVERKGIGNVITALAELPGADAPQAGAADAPQAGAADAAQAGAAELVIAGGEGNGDPDAARLRECAARAGVVDRVDLIGPVARPDVPALLRSADAVVCVPWYEPFGIVPLEAMACGRPVVASAVGGMQDTVVDQVTGLLVPARRPDVLAAALRELLGSPTLGTAFGIAGRDRVLARYDWERVAAATAAVYEDVVAVHRGRRCPVSRREDVERGMPARTAGAAR
jgi:glycosyltransferase involved in cell wall biosynthesis